jgi:hypothetical protein
MAARTRKRRLALRYGVEMQRVFAGRQAFHVEIDRHPAALGRRDHRHADRIALGILQLYMLHLRRRLFRRLAAPPVPQLKKYESFTLL